MQRLFSVLLLAALSGSVACEELLSQGEGTAVNNRRRRRTTPRTTPQQNVPQQQQQPQYYPQQQQPGGGAMAAQLGGPEVLRVSFLEVGQGDSALLETNDGHAALIDTGPPEGRSNLNAALTAHGITRLDWVVLTHPHLDHIGNAQVLLDRVQIGRIVDPGYPHPIATYSRLLGAIQAHSIPYAAARRGMSLPLGSVSVTVLLPREPFVDRSRSEVNANSVVVRVVAGSVRFLFTGDAESETEERLLAESAPSLPADVLKVAHHGSRYASTAAFLNAVAPRVAVISCSTDNDYGHPSTETLTALSQRSAMIYRTDLHGEVQVHTDGARYTITTSRMTTPAALMTGGVSRGRREAP